MDLHPTTMSKFKANAYGIASSLSKALESVGSKRDHTHQPSNNNSYGGSQKMLNNNPNNFNDLASHSNYNYSPLNGNHNNDHNLTYPASTSNSPSNRHSKFDNSDYTPKCMRPKSLSFHEVQEEQLTDVSPPVLTSSTNPFLPSASISSTRQFIYNDLRKDDETMQNRPWEEEKSGRLGQELQELKTSRNENRFLETDFESDSGIGYSEPTKPSFKLNLGIPMVGMVPNAELVKINTQHPTSPKLETHPVTNIQPSQAAPLSSIFGLPVVAMEPPSPESKSVDNIASYPLVQRHPTSILPHPVNPNSKSTDIF